MGIEPVTLHYQCYDSIHIGSWSICLYAMNVHHFISVYIIVYLRKSFTLSHLKANLRGWNMVFTGSVSSCWVTGSVFRETVCCVFREVQHQIQSVNSQFQ